MAAQNANGWGATPGPRTGWSRRDVLRAGGAGALGLGLGWGGSGSAFGRSGRDEPALILLMLVGGPSQLETFDPKPDAPADVRGPLGSIATRIPGVRLGAGLPGLAQRLDRVSLVRTLNHDAAPIHETGQQLIQTGRLDSGAAAWPHLGAVAAQQLGSRGAVAPFVMLPGPIGHTGVAVSHGQSAGDLGPAFEPRLADDADLSLAAALDVSSERARDREAYGATDFGRNCLRARRLVEAGARVVVVNMYPTVFGGPSWDAHGREPFATLADYRDSVLPSFDRAFCALIDDLTARGRLDSTLVVATGEFGRTPRLNTHGGRDHWPSAWSAVLAGGGIAGGRVLGRTDAHAAEPVDRPVAPAELYATMHAALGLDPHRPPSRPDGSTLDSGPLAEPLAELFA